MNSTRWRKRLLGITGLAGAAALAVAGCSSSSGTTSTGSSSPPARVPLVVYSAQKVMRSGDPTGDSLYYPVLQGVAPLPALSGVQTQTIDPYTWGSKEATINTWFDNNIVR